MIAIVCHRWLSESAIQKKLGEQMETLLVEIGGQVQVDSIIVFL